MTKILRLVVLISGVLVSGCASIVGDQTQPVSIDTPACPEASCRLTNSQGSYFVKSTPETIIVNKAYSDLLITCEKEGLKETSTHPSNANIATYGNVLIGGIIGALIDGGSGAGYDYPNNLNNHLACSGSPNSNTPSLTREAPSSPSKAPSVTRKAPSSPSKSPSLTREAPSSPRKSPSLTNKTPIFTRQEPSLTSKAPSSTGKIPLIRYSNPFDKSSQ